MAKELGEDGGSTNSGASVPPPNWFQQLWGATKKKAVDHIATTIVVGGALALATGATATWAVLKQWMVIQFPSGAVVAFAVPCPTEQGWNEYGQAAGRFIVGANLDQRNGLKNRLPSDQPSGRETITLRPSQLPHLTLHSETLKLIHITDTGPSPHNAVVRTDANIGTTTIETNFPEKGEQEPIDNMPPYLALYYCKKG
jgi:hypothetical protein